MDSSQGRGLAVKAKPGSVLEGRSKTTAAQGPVPELGLRRCIGLGISGADCHAATAWHPTSPNLLAFASGCNLALLDTLTKNQIQLLRTKRTAPRLPLQCLTFHPAGTHIAAGEGGAVLPEVLVWELSTGRITQQLKHHKHGVRTVAYNQDGRWLLSVGEAYDAQVCLWDWQAGSLLAKVNAQLSVLSACFTDDGAAVLCAGKGQLKMWSILTTHKSGPGSRPSTAGGHQTVSLQPRTVVFRDFRNDTFLALQSSVGTCGGQPGRGIAASSPAMGASGPTCAYAVTKGGALLLLSRSGGRAVVEKSVDLQVKAAHGLAVSRDLVAACCAAGVVRLFDTNTLLFRCNLPRPSPMLAAVQRCSGLRHSLVVNTPGGQSSGGMNSSGRRGVSSLGTALQQGAQGELFPDAVHAAFSGAGQRLTVCYADHTLIVWDVSDLSKIQRVRCMLAHSEAIWDAALLPSAAHPTLHTAPALGPTGSTGAASALTSLVTCGADGTVRVWSIDTALSSGSSGGGAAPVVNHARNCGTLRGVLVARTLDVDAGGDSGPGSLDDRLIVSAGAAAGATKDAASQIVRLRCLCVSGDGRHLATGDMQGNVRVYDLFTLSLLEEAVKEAHEGPVLAMDYSPASHDHPGFLATAGRDGVVHVFDASNGYTLVNTLEEHNAAVTAVKFSPCGTRLLSASVDRQLVFRHITNPSDCTTAAYATERMPSSAAGPAAAKGNPPSGVVKGAVNAIAVHGNMVVAAVHGGLLRVYSLETGSLTGLIDAARLCGSTAVDVLRVTLDPSATCAACACSDGTIAVFALNASKPPPRLSNPGVAKPGTHAGGKLVAAAPAKGVVSAQLLARVAGHAEMVTGVVLLDGASGLVSVGGDGCILQWQLPAAVQAHMQRAAACAGTRSQRSTSSSTGAARVSADDVTVRVSDVQTPTVVTAGGKPPSGVAVVGLGAEGPKSPREGLQQPMAAPATQQPASPSAHLPALISDPDSVSAELSFAADLASNGNVSGTFSPDNTLQEGSAQEARMLQQSKTLARVRQGLPMQSADKLPRWAVARLDSVLHAAGAGQDAQGGAQHPTAALDLGGAGLSAHSRPYAHEQVPPQAALWNIDLEEDEDMCAFGSEDGGEGAEANPSLLCDESDIASTIVPAAPGLSQQAEVAATAAAAALGAESVTSRVREGRSSGARRFEVRCSTVFSEGDRASDEEPAADVAEAEAGAPPRSGHASNHPKQRQQGAAAAAAQAEPEAAAGGSQAVCRDLFRELYGNLGQDCQMSRTNTPLGPATAAAGLTPATGRLPLTPVAAGAAGAAAAVPQAAHTPCPVGVTTAPGVWEQATGTRRFSLTAAVRKLATSLLSAGAAGEAALDGMTSGAASSPPTQVWAGTATPATLAAHAPALNAPATGPGNAPGVLTPGPQHLRNPPPGTGTSDATEAVSALTPVPLARAPDAATLAAREAYRNNRAGRLEGDLAKMKERLAALQTQFAEQQARSTPWRMREPAQQRHGALHDAADGAGAADPDSEQLPTATTSPGQHGLSATPPHMVSTACALRNPNASTAEDVPGYDEDNSTVTMGRVTLDLEDVFTHIRQPAVQPQPAMNITQQAGHPWLGSSLRQPTTQQPVVEADAEEGAAQGAKADGKAAGKPAHKRSPAGSPKAKPGPGVVMAVAEQQRPAQMGRIVRAGLKLPACTVQMHGNKPTRTESHGTAAASEGSAGAAAVQMQVVKQDSAGIPGCSQVSSAFHGTSKQPAAGDDAAVARPGASSAMAEESAAGCTEPAGKSGTPASVTPVAAVTGRTASPFHLTSPRTATRYPLRDGEDTLKGAYRLATQSDVDTLTPPPIPSTSPCVSHGGAGAGPEYQPHSDPMVGLQTNLVYDMECGPTPQLLAKSGGNTSTDPTMQSFMRRTMDRTRASPNASKTKFGSLMEACAALAEHHAASGQQQGAQPQPAASAANPPHPAVQQAGRSTDGADSQSAALQETCGVTQKGGVVTDDATVCSEAGSQAQPCTLSQNPAAQQHATAAQQVPVEPRMVAPSGMTPPAGPPHLSVLSALSPRAVAVVLQSQGSPAGSPVGRQRLPVMHQAALCSLAEAVAAVEACVEHMERARCACASKETASANAGGAVPGLHGSGARSKASQDHPAQVLFAEKLGTHIASLQGLLVRIQKHP